MDDEIDPEELERLLGDGEDVRVVDIRGAPAFDRGHIPGSENIPFDELPQRVGELDDADRVVTVCPHGKASVQAASLVRSYEGIPDDASVVSLAGGLEAWDGPLETTDDGEEAEDGEGTERTRSPF